MMICRVLYGPNTVVRGYAHKISALLLLTWPESMAKYAMVANVQMKMDEK